MLGVIGIIISLAIIIVGAYKGWHVFPLAVLGGIIVALCNHMGLWTALSTNFAAGWMSWAGGYFLLFALGALFGELMAVSGAARSIAYKISDLFGASRTPIAIAVITLVLTYGGINSFVVAFTLYPLAMVMCNEANIPRSLAVAGMLLGAGTATQTSLPGTPSTQNLVPTTLLGTTSTAAPAIGIVCGIIMVVCGIVYLSWQTKVYKKKGIGFVALPQDGLGDGSVVRTEAPNFGISLLPIIVVIVCIFATKNALPALASVSLSLFIGCVLTTLFFWKRLPDKKGIINKGFSSSIAPLMNTAAIIGYGTVVQASPAFQSIILFAQNLQMNPYATVAIGVNILAGVSGSSSGGLKIFLESMGQFFLNEGVNPEALHRVAAVASGGLDTLPHNGAVISMFAIFGTNHKESYRHVFVLCCALPIIATIVAVIMANAMYPIV